jgi:hypothetical protein
MQHETELASAELAEIPAASTDAASAASEPEAFPLGLIRDLPDSVYYKRDPAIASKSGLDHLAESPIHYLAWCRGKDEDSDALRFGKAFHAFVLEPTKFAASFVELPSDAPKRPTLAQWNAKKPGADSIAAMEFWSAFNAEHAGKAIIDSEDLETIRRMADALTHHKFARDLIVAGNA